MSFYNRAVQMVRTFTNDISAAEPLDVVSYGGLQQVKVTTVVGNVAVLAAPAAGKCYRLHRLNAFNPNAGGWLIGVTTVDAYGFFNATQNSDNLMGQLISSEALEINCGTAGISVTLTYDNVLFPDMI